MIRFEGDRRFAHPPAVVWPKFRDARFLIECVPDGTPTGKPTQDHADARVRPAFAFVRGTMDIALDVAQSVENKSLLVRIKSKGVGTSSEVEALLEFSDRDRGTYLHWTAEIKQLGGLLKAVPSGLIKGAAQKVIDGLWQRVTQRIEREASEA
jgi:carbon monoxide dehydrogenase subunit G